MEPILRTFSHILVVFTSNSAKNCLVTLFMIDHTYVMRLIEVSLASHKPPVWTTSFYKLTFFREMIALTSDAKGSGSLSNALKIASTYLAGHVYQHVHVHVVHFPRTLLINERNEIPMQPRLPNIY